MSYTSEQLTFGLVHGSWHGAWCWDEVRYELESAGHTTVAVDMPIDNPDANFDDYAEVVKQSLEGMEDVVLVGHSRGGNIIPRVAGSIAVKKLIYIASAFEPATIGRPTVSEARSMPLRNGTGFASGIVNIIEDMTMYDPEHAKEMFYHDCPPDVQTRAADQLRPQRRSEDEPSLDMWPEVPQEYIVCTNDRIVNPDWARYVSRHWLGVEPIEIESGHSPFLSVPHDLAKLVLTLSEK